MRHLLLIDPLEKLNIKKDSTLMLALAMQRRGIEVYVLFESDFAIQNGSTHKLKVHSFEGRLKDDGIYLEEFKTSGVKILELGSTDVLHMRLDPPFDSRYLRVLWMLDHLVSQGIRVLNDPKGIMLFNEKLYAYRQDGSFPSYVGASLRLAQEFVIGLDPAPEHLILKPMDLYSGIGVEKLSLDQWEKRFEEKVIELTGPVIVQPFKTEVLSGEVRSLYFKGQELGSIMKTPKKGEFLSNIAQGATFHACELSKLSRKRCEAIVSELANYGVGWVAFDILADSITEVNITCPGLLTEVSYAHEKNLADTLIDLLV